MKWGSGNAEFKLLAGIDLKDMGIVNVPAVHGNFKIDGAKLLVPGQPVKSMLYQRMNLTGLGCRTSARTSWTRSARRWCMTGSRR
jgi:hypothetical protein